MVQTFGMIKNFVFRLLFVCSLIVGCFHQTFAQITIPAGSYVVDMGVNSSVKPAGLRPYGMIHELVKYYNVPVIWVVKQGKVKDATDYTIEGVAYKGGLFVIPANYITGAVLQSINGWRTIGRAHV